MYAYHSDPYTQDFSFDYVNNLFNLFSAHFIIRSRIKISRTTNSRQAIIISTIFYTLFSIQMFDLPYSILFINPFTTTIVMYTYIKFAATYFAVAAASAMSIVVLSAIIVIPYALYGLKKWITPR